MNKRATSKFPIGGITKIKCFFIIKGGAAAGKSSQKLPILQDRSLGTGIFYNSILFKESNE